MDTAFCLFTLKVNGQVHCGLWDTMSFAVCYGCMLHILENVIDHSDLIYNEGGIMG